MLLHHEEMFYSDIFKSSLAVQPDKGLVEIIPSDPLKCLAVVRLRPVFTDTIRYINPRIVARIERV